MKFNKITVSYGKKISANYNTKSFNLTYDIELNEAEGKDKKTVDKIVEIMHDELEKKVTELLSKEEE